MRHKQNAYNILSTLYGKPNIALLFDNDGNPKRYLEHSDPPCASISVVLLEFPIKAIPGANSCSVHRYMAAVRRLPEPM